MHGSEFVSHSSQSFGGQDISAPLFEASAWSDFVGHIWQSEPDHSRENCRYSNAGTCPDCGVGMVRLGTCMSCPTCGYGSCGE